MTGIHELIARTADAESTLAARQEAFGEVVLRFQDMAFGYAFAVLGDFHLAEEVSQEAFLTAWEKIKQVREPAAFPGWFKQVVRTHCNRLTRARRLKFVPLDEGPAPPSAEPGQQAGVERQELREKMLTLIEALPENERTAVTLFYIGEYSRRDISDFLGVPETTVAKRLHSARRRLQAGMLELLKADLRERRPSGSEMFLEQIRTRLRPLDERDWTPVADVASRVESDLRAEDDLWLRNRRGFDDESRARRHYVVEHAGAGKIVGYGAIEQDPAPDRFRLHLVVDPRWLRAGPGDLLLARLTDDLRGLNASSVWARNYEHLTDLHSFLRERGFAEKILVWDLRFPVAEADLSAALGVARRVAERGVTITTVAEELGRDPDCLRRLHEALTPVWADDPKRLPIRPFERTAAYFENPLVLRDGCFVAKHGGRYVGYTDLNLMEALAGGVTQNFTGVVREHRRQGVATALKARAVEYARGRGYKTIRAFNYPCQQGIRELNEKIGFRCPFGYVTMEKALK